MLIRLLLVVMVVAPALGCGFPHVSIFGITASQQGELVIAVGAAERREGCGPTDHGDARVLFLTGDPPTLRTEWTLRELEAPAPRVVAMAEGDDPVLLYGSPRFRYGDGSEAVQGHEVGPIISARVLGVGSSFVALSDRYVVANAERIQGLNRQGEILWEHAYPEPVDGETCGTSPCVVTERIPGAQVARSPDGSLVVVARACTRFFEECEPDRCTVFSTSIRVLTPDGAEHVPELLNSRDDPSRLRRYVLPAIQDGGRILAVYPLLENTTDDLGRNIQTVRNEFELLLPDGSVSASGSLPGYALEVDTAGEGFAVLGADAIQPTQTMLWLFDGDGQQVHERSVALPIVVSPDREYNFAHSAIPAVRATIAGDERGVILVHDDPDELCLRVLTIDLAGTTLDDRCIDLTDHLPDGRCTGV